MFAKESLIENPNFKKFLSRFRSFAWRLGSYLAVSALAWVGANIGLLEFSPATTTVIALIFGEITKFLNTKKSVIPADVH